MHKIIEEKGYKGCKAIINEKKGNDFAIDQLFIYLKIFFEEDVENPISKIPKETKFGDILDEIYSVQNMMTFREVIEKIVEINSITYSFSNKNDLFDLEGLVKRIEYTKGNISSKIDATSTIDFFSKLTIADICSYQLNMPEPDFLKD